MSDSANKITAEIQLKASEVFPDVRLWRVNTGLWAPFERVKQALYLLTKRQYSDAIAVLQKCRPIRSGINGQPDLQGFVSCLLRGSRVALFIAIEVKAEGDAMGDDQILWRDMAVPLGVIFIEARSVDQCLTDLRARLADL